MEQSCVSWLDNRKYDVSDEHQFWNYDYYGDYVLWKQLFTGDDAMRRRMALALSEFFVTSMSVSTAGWRGYLYGSWWDMLMRNAFGNFRSLLEEVTLHPAMGDFLNTNGNKKENLSTGRVPDENYAREVMQLFSIGLHKLNLDGTPVLDSNGSPVETYDEDDVTNLARVFTGYEFDFSDGVTLPVPGAQFRVNTTMYTRKPMKFIESNHSTLEVRFLGTVIPAGTPGRAALGIALNTLFNHPNVAPFFARQMIQRLVTSNPSSDYVARVATVFNNDGTGQRGNLKAVWRAILLDSTARGPEHLANAYFGKVREPMLRFIQWGRTFKLSSALGTWKINKLSDPANQLGQSPLRPPSVFNFFRPGYIPPNTAFSAIKATSPEFQIVNESTVGGYLNYMQRVIRDGIGVGNASQNYDDYRNVTFDIRPDYTAEIQLSVDAVILVDHLNVILASGQLSAATRKVIYTALNATPVNASSSFDSKLNRVAAAVLMVMACPEYLVQR